MKTKTITRGDYHKLSDEELVFRYAARQEQVAVLILFERYGHLVYAVCAKHMNAAAAEQTTQKIFISLLSDLKHFDIDHFKSWLYKVTINYCLGKTEPEEVVYVKPGEAPPKKKFAVNVDADFEEGVQYEIERDNLYGKLARAIGQLDKEEKENIELFYFQNKTYREIAEITGKTIDKIKTAIQNGKKVLRQKLDAEAKKN